MSEPGETPAQFQRRIREACHEARDLELEKLRGKYAPKLQTLQNQIDRAQTKVETEQEQVAQKTNATAINVGSTLLGALFGRKLFSYGNVGRASSSMRSASQIGKEKRDVERAQAKLDDLRIRLMDLESDLEIKINEIKAEVCVEEMQVEEIEIRAKKADLAINRIALVWLPWWKSADGSLEPAFEI